MPIEVRYAGTRHPCSPPSSPHCWVFRRACLAATAGRPARAGPSSPRAQPACSGAGCPARTSRVPVRVPGRHPALVECPEGQRHGHGEYAGRPEHPERFPGGRIAGYLGIEERRGGQITAAVRPHLERRADWRVGPNGHLVGDFRAIGRPPPGLSLPGKLPAIRDGRGRREHDRRDLALRSLWTSCACRAVPCIHAPVASAAKGVPIRNAATSRASTAVSARSAARRSGLRSNRHRRTTCPGG